MPTPRTQNPTNKELLNRLNNIRVKLSNLRQEEDKINQKLSHEYAQSLSKYLMDANAIEIDFDILLGGILEVISVAKSDSSRREAWQKAGQMFCRTQKRASISFAKEKIERRESKIKPRTHIASARYDKNANTTNE